MSTQTPSSSAAAASADGGDACASDGGDATLWDAQRVVQWLRSDAGPAAAQYCDTFAAAHVCGEDLLDMTDADLERDLGIESGLKRKQILKAIQRLKAAQPKHADDSPRSRYALHPQPEQISMLDKMMSDSWAKQDGDQLCAIVRVTVELAAPCI